MDIKERLKRDASLPQWDDQSRLLDLALCVEHDDQEGLAQHRKAWVASQQRDRFRDHARQLRDAAAKAWADCHAAVDGDPAKATKLLGVATAAQATADAFDQVFVSSRWAAPRGHWREHRAIWPTTAHAELLDGEATRSWPRAVMAHGLLRRRELSGDRSIGAPFTDSCLRSNAGPVAVTLSHVANLRTRLERMDPDGADARKTRAELSRYDTALQQLGA